MIKQRFNPIDNTLVHSIPYERTVQERKCKNCFKVQQEIICD